MSKNTKRQRLAGNRTGVDRKIAREPGRESALPIHEPAPGSRVQPHPQDEHRTSSRR
jgi:hypothetical protein